MPTSSPEVRRITEAMLRTLFEHDDFAAITVQDALNIGASVLVSLLKTIELPMEPAQKFEFRRVLGVQLHAMADGVTAGAFRFDYEPPEVAH